jgi:hypothetical protein
MGTVRMGSPTQATKLEAMPVSSYTRQSRRFNLVAARVPPCPRQLAPDLPCEALAKREKTLLGFEVRYARIPLFGRRIHISSSVVDDPAIAPATEVKAARELVGGLVEELIKRGANFVIPVDREPIRTCDDLCRSAATG